MDSYDHKAIEAKWRKVWLETKLDTPDLARAQRPFDKAAGKPFYNLMMFPYPSAEGLHVGNMYAFTGSDIYGRFKRMQGYDCFEPIGLDGFGIHSENYAFKVGKHPADQAKISEERFYSQLGKIGCMYDWDRTLETYDLEYYRWTQWLFVQMFKHGLAYRATAEVNWCPSCKTVLADEQVLPAGRQGIDERCERCGNKVSKKPLQQWFFRITAYAGKLLENTFSLDWPEKVLIAQRNWIGKKDGINITYQIIDSDDKPVGEVTCFTTRPDTNFGATFVVLAPEHPFVAKLLNSEPKKVRQYVEQAKKKSKKERIAEGRKKTGVFTGLYCLNQLNTYKMPAFISDFVVMDVGTGAVVGVPGHDKRDFEFAQVMKLPVVRVVVGPDGDTSPITRIEQVLEDEGTMVNSEFLNGLGIGEATKKIMDYLEEKGWGKRVVSYHLRDWIISRQRYWGPPIPMIYCEKCATEGKSWFTTKEARALLGITFSAHPPNPNSSSPLATTREDMAVREKGHLAAQSSFIENFKLKIENSASRAAGWYPVPEDQLPVELPYIEDYKPGDDGVAPLAKHKEFYHIVCPECRSAARRETDVSDTFLDSAWYFLRYPSVRKGDESFQPDAVRGSLFAAHPSSVGNKRVTRAGGPPRRSPPMGVLGGKPAAGPAGSSLRVTVLEKGHLAASNQNLPWDPEITKKWLPVSMYTGGAEHSVLHLLYSRFIWMALRDWGYLDFSGKVGSASGWDEPFPHFFAHGLIIKDGAKMSKSKGNIVNPDDYIVLYGADALRLYLVFTGPFDQGGDFRDSAMEGMSRWVKRIWRMAMNSLSGSTLQDSARLNLQKALHRLVKKVGEDIEKRRYNTAIAAMMEFTNLVADNGGVLSRDALMRFVLLLAPFAPYLAEELWQRVAAVRGSYSTAEDMAVLENARRAAAPTSEFWSVHQQPWPTYDPKLLEEDTVTIIVQVNGKLRDTCHVSRVTCHEQRAVEALARKSEKVKKYLEGKRIKKIIFVSKKLMNFVV